MYALRPYFLRRIRSDYSERKPCFLCTNVNKSAFFCFRLDRWVEMEISLALVFGVQVLVCARWGPKVCRDCFFFAFTILPSKTIPYRTIPYRTTPHHTTPHHTTLHHTTPYHTIPYHTISYHTISYHIMPYHTIPYHTIT